MIGHGIGLVARLHRFALPPIFRGVPLRVRHHAIDLLLRELGRATNCDTLLLASGFVACRDRENAVGVNVEGDVDLRHPARGGRNAFEPKMAECAVVARQFAFALQHMDIHGALVVVSGRKGLRTAYRDGRVALDQFGHDATKRFHPERQRCDVQQHDVLYFARQHAGLNGRPNGDDFIRIHRLIRFLPACQPTDQRLHGWDAGGATDQHHFIQITGCQFRIRQRLLHRPDAALDQISGQLLELGPRQPHLQMPRSSSICRDEG